jgi:hypothetical protein
MKYLVDGIEMQELEFWSEFSNIIQDYVDENLDDFIDEMNEEVTIGSLTYYPSLVLKEVDPIAYRCYGDDLHNHFYCDFKYELERYGECQINGTEFIIEDNEEEEE